jgi:hypothetical protein
MEPRRVSVRHITVTIDRSARGALSGAALTALLLSSACTGDEASSMGNACRQSWAEVDERFGHDGAVPGFAAEDDASVVLKVQNSADDDRSLTVDLDGVSAVDIEVPGSLSCDHPAVLTLGFDHPPGELRVEAQSDGNSSSEQLTISETEPTWVVVEMTSDQITTEVWDRLPEFG